MSTFYDQMATTASSLISQFGADVTIVREQDGSINPVTGAITEGTTELLTVKGIMRSYPEHLIDETRIKSTDKMLILEPKIKPELTDKIRFDNQDWVIDEVTSNSPAGIPLTYSLKVHQ